MTLLSAQNVYKTYRLGKVDVPVLRGATLEVKRGECVAVLGASGSGKSTLLHLLGGLDRSDQSRRRNGAGGAVLFEGKPLDAMSNSQFNRYRNQSVGFVFQFYHLLPELSVLENVAVASMVKHGLAGYLRRASEIRKQAQGILDEFGLGSRLKHRPAELSGGERQRVAIARALINKPDVLLADEPTGNLDTKTGAHILDLLDRLRAEHSQTMVMVTHDQATAARADRVVRLVEGRVETGQAVA